MKIQRWRRDVWRRVRAAPDIARLVDVNLGANPAAREAVGRAAGSEEQQISPDALFQAIPRAATLCRLVTARDPVAIAGADCVTRPVVVSSFALPLLQKQPDAMQVGRQHRQGNRARKPVRAMASSTPALVTRPGVRPCWTPAEDCVLVRCRNRSRGSRSVARANQDGLQLPLRCGTPAGCAVQSPRMDRNRRRDRRRAPQPHGNPASGGRAWGERSPPSTGGAVNYGSATSA